MINFQEYTPGMELTGFILNMPESEYFKAEEFSYSASKEFMKSPAHYQAYLTKEHETDPEQEMFKAVQLRCLEADKANRIVTVDGRWAGKVKEEVLARKADGYIVLKPEALDRAREIAASVQANPDAMGLLQNSYNEVSLFWIDPSTGVKCKGRLDILSRTDKGYEIVDLKNLSQLHNEEMITNQVMRMQYAHQMAFYSIGFNALTGDMPVSCSWIFVEDEKPYGVKVRSCPFTLVNDNWMSYISTIIPKYKECLFSNQWPLYETGRKDIQLPKWYKESK